MSQLKALPGRCEEASPFSMGGFLPCNNPATRVIGWKSGEGPYRMCPTCAATNLRRGAIDMGPYKETEDA